VKEAIVLAGGRGTRLRRVVSDLPKPMASVAGRPFLECTLRYLKKEGIGKVILSVGYMWETIRDYFGNEFEGIELIYSVEDHPLGTGGAIAVSLALTSTSEVYIVNGDSFFDIPLSELTLEKEESGMSMALKEMRDFDRYGCVELDKGGVVKDFEEKKYRLRGLINAGVYRVRRDIFAPFDLPERFSFEEFMQQERERLHIEGKVFEGYFIDIGIPEDFERAQKEMKEHC